MIDSILLIPTKSNLITEKLVLLGFVLLRIKILYICTYEFLEIKSKQIMRLARFGAKIQIGSIPTSVYDMSIERWRNF